MTFIAEAGRSLKGAWLLFADRADALAHFNVSRAGFYRSFAAFFIALPFYLVTIHFEQGQPVAVPGGIILDGSGAWGSRLIALALTWLALPALLRLAARPLAIEATYRQFVIARNWASVLVSIPYAIVAPLRTVAGTGGELGEILALATLFLVVRFLYLVARRALGAGLVLAVFVVAASLLLGWFIDAAAGALIPF